MDYKARYQPLEGLTDLGWQTITPLGAPRAGER